MPLDEADKVHPSLLEANLGHFSRSYNSNNGLT